LPPAPLEPVTACDAGVEHGQQVQAGGPHLEPPCLGHRDHRAPVDVCVLRQAGVCHTWSTLSRSVSRAGAARGSCAGPPVRLWPASTVSRFVPSRLISAISPACEEEDSPRTPTIAAVPIAIPSAERAARSGRARSPTLATRRAPFRCTVA